ncbi:YheC/YheD family endospore coat-associated protein [Paenibacillus apiarius]|uniref:YheC/YheD family protein n=1 Tax=Paenibacillus apiarius TaxID=46240 RepID=A0ABT4E1X8_9BACL|nr:YheC/YheD family protein [Paenibacillus apiarius]MCY9512586.1 YheC/YheD family protein [Paenibacillus apiarius]MCY9522343.1 YheC/YheD family protein [Paenibacillus apiarius]MCY9553693.1 YheC/YheD family protein [Paenibacillus apiarius]MCY9556636.1 YheC/YheD family protein [Paenibacillus apiarius]MCY9682827.1 YheC/YheD family protein [Paenibacillus apiarius]
MSDNRIGILFNANLLRGLIRGKTKHEAIAFYEEAARKLGVIPCYFRIEDVDIRHMEVTAYVRGRGGYVKRRMPLPRVIHNRAIYFRSAAHARVRALVEREVALFNQVNRYGKMTIHDLLSTDRSIAPHLPDTAIAHQASITAMMDRYDALILKPDNSSIGRGVMKLERKRSGWRTTYMVRTANRVRHWKIAETEQGSLPWSVMSKLANETYLVQQLLPLATYQQRPFDLRVSVQRDGTEEWQITGIVGKVAPPHTFLTNVAQGGTVQRFEDLAAAACPHLPYAVLHQRISEFSLRVACRLSEVLPRLADIGLDIGVSPDGMPLFIECNGRDQRYSFREANQIETWKATYANPIAYGVSLLHQYQHR